MTGNWKSSYHDCQCRLPWALWLEKLSGYRTVWVLCATSRSMDGMATANWWAILFFPMVAFSHTLTFKSSFGALILKTCVECAFCSFTTHCSSHCMTHHLHLLSFYLLPIRFCWGVSKATPLRSCWMRSHREPDMDGCEIHRNNYESEMWWLMVGAM